MPAISTVHADSAETPTHLAGRIGSRDITRTPYRTPLEAVQFGSGRFCAQSNGAHVLVGSTFRPISQILQLIRFLQQIDTHGIRTRISSAPPATSTRSRDFGQDDICAGS